MSGFCKKCGMSFDGSNCPICHGKTKTNAKTVASSVVIVGVVFLFGILLYTGEIEINHEKLDEIIQQIPKNIQDVGKTSQDFANETSIVLQETVGKVQNKVTETIESTPSIQERIESAQNKVVETVKPISSNENDRAPFTSTSSLLKSLVLNCAKKLSAFLKKVAGTVNFEA